MSGGRVGDHVRKLGQMVRWVYRGANEPARRFKLLWYVFAWAVAGLELSLGVIYASASKAAVSGHTLDRVAALEGNSLRPHGFILLALALLFVYSMAPFRRLTKWALFAIAMYATWTLSLIIGQIVVGGASWGAVPWYTFLIVIATGLFILSPPLGSDGRLYQGERSASA